MTELPTPRLAVPADRDSLFRMCCELWEENGLFPISETKVRRMIDIATDNSIKTEQEPIAMIWCIGDVGKIEASLCLIITQNWYSDAWHVEELWNFVHPDHRRSNYAKALIDYSKKVQSEIGLPLMIGILSNDRTQEKVRLYSRRLGQPAGAYFVYPSWNALRDEKKSAA